MNILGVSIDERFLTHRLKSTSTAGISGALVGGALFLHHYYIRHVFSWDLFAVIATIAVVKISLMIWYRLND
jgi:hypothetical protein